MRGAQGITGPNLLPGHLSINSDQNQPPTLLRTSFTAGNVALYTGRRQIDSRRNARTMDAERRWCVTTAVGRQESVTSPSNGGDNADRIVRKRLTIDESTEAEARLDISLLAMKEMRRPGDRTDGGGGDCRTTLSRSLPPRRMRTAALTASNFAGHVASHVARIEC